MTPFAGEDLLRLAAEAIEESGASLSDPIDYAGIRERYLPERGFRGKSQHHKSHFALTAAATLRAGVYPDLDSEADYWGMEGFWLYAFYALVIYVRAAAERTDRSVEAVARAPRTPRGALFKLGPADLTAPPFRETFRPTHGYNFGSPDRLLKLKSRGM